MIFFDDIQRFYPDDLQNRGEHLLREYLQYEILKLVFEGKYAHRYTFLGSTCLRVCYGTQRFSEDVDLNGADLTEKEFAATAAAIKQGLERLGFTVTISFAYKGAFHCNIRFPALLYQAGLSPHKEARLLVKMDTEKQHYDYERKLVEINKFGVKVDVLAVPLELLTSQKIAAIMGRKRSKGRDFFDLTWILGQTTPDYGYLDARFQVTTAEGLRSMVAAHIAAFNFEELAQDVQDFLFTPEDIAAVAHFPTFWQQAKLA